MVELCSHNSQFFTLKSQNVPYNHVARCVDISKRGLFTLFSLIFQKGTKSQDPDNTTFAADKKTLFIERDVGISFHLNCTS